MIMKNEQHLPCPCGNSSDAYSEYSTGGYCFSCGKKFWKDKPEEVIEDMDEYSVQQIPYRAHTLASLQKYDVKQRIRDADGELLETLYPYSDQSVKHRRFDGDRKGKFYWDNYKGPGLFGADKFDAGSALAITITEGEEDTLSAYAMLGHRYPVVSVQSASQARADCAAMHDYLMSFEKIYLCFDNDEAGHRAEAQVSSLFPYNKIFVVKKTKYKDANDYEKNNAHDEYKRLWFNAKRHDPENIVASFSDIEALFKAPKKRAIASFPFEGLQKATYGIRTGETYLFKALEGIGKTEVLGAIEYHVAKTEGFPIGIIHLEEDIQRSAYRLVGYEVEQPVHLEGFTDFNHEQLMEVYRKVAKEDNRVNFYQAGKNDNDVAAFLNAIRFMVASAGCKIVFFDHISRVATSFNLDVAGLDNFATSLAKMAVELDFALLMITHVNDDGLTRGSRNISKEAWTVISLNRDKLNPDPLLRNTTSFVVEKNRHASITGPAGCVYFDPMTFKVTDEPPIEMPVMEAS